ncbi:hypothetical protein N656DRAFT_163669 [Canariomyces notabilis]|uniref:Uncharacterized protein n=1 Tax=Canariomyces notabilis TaxID=2074819 RepID=A0AAN6TBS6_9PEZI|nr:hypothetical protein N656DRAFT_163669 [Canariomyces arenarius]
MSRTAEDKGTRLILVVIHLPSRLLFRIRSANCNRPYERTTQKHNDMNPRLHHDRDQTLAFPGFLPLSEEAVQPLDMTRRDANHLETPAISGGNNVPGVSLASSIILCLATSILRIMLSISILIVHVLTMPAKMCAWCRTRNHHGQDHRSDHTSGRSRIHGGLRRKPKRAHAAVSTGALEQLTQLVSLLDLNVISVQDLADQPSHLSISRKARNANIRVDTLSDLVRQLDLNKISLQDLTDELSRLQVRWRGTETSGSAGISSVKEPTPNAQNREREKSGTDMLALSDRIELLVLSATGTSIEDLAEEVSGLDIDSMWSCLRKLSDALDQLKLEGSS